MSICFQVTSVVPEAVTDNLVSAFRDARHSLLDNAQTTGMYNLYKPPAARPLWMRHPSGIGGLGRAAASRTPHVWRGRAPLELSAPRKARMHPYVPWRHMSSHLVHAPTYLGESCLWSAPYEKCESVQIHYTYNARCEHRAEIVVIPREALSNILTCFSPWLPERFECPRLRAG